jgi:hypothetical protein
MADRSGCRIHPRLGRRLTRLGEQYDRLAHHCRRLVSALREQDDLDMSSERRPVTPPDHCAECSFEAAAVTPPNAVGTVRALGGRYRAALHVTPDHDPPDALSRRPNAQTWSALEYTGHMRDVIALWGSALHQALTQERPQIQRPDPDIADRIADEQDYNRQDPAAVLDQLSANAERMAAKVAKVGPEDWQRAVVIGGEPVTTLAIVRKVAHEGEHHLLDVGRCLQAVRLPGSPQPD